MIDQTIKIIINYCLLLLCECEWTVELHTISKVRTFLIKKTTAR